MSPDGMAPPTPKPRICTASQLYATYSIWRQPPDVQHLKATTSSLDPFGALRQPQQSSERYLTAKPQWMQ